MKKKMIWVIGIILILVLVYFFVPGLMKNSSAVVADYSVSEDGREITIKFSVLSSIGYIRDVAVHQQHGGKLYLDCYSAFGGLNGRIGTKDTLTFQIDEDTSIIAIYRNTNAYEEVLVKAEDGSWNRAAQ